MCYIESHFLGSIVVLCIPGPKENVTGSGQFEQHQELPYEDVVNSRVLRHCRLQSIESALVAWLFRGYWEVIAWASQEDPPRWWEMHRYKLSGGARENGKERADRPRRHCYLHTEDREGRLARDVAETRIGSARTGLSEELWCRRGRGRRTTQSKCLLPSGKEIMRQTPISSVDRTVADSQRFAQQTCCSPFFVSCPVNNSLDFMARKSRKPAHACIKSVSRAKNILNMAAVRCLAPSSVRDNLWGPTIPYMPLLKVGII